MEIGIVKEIKDHEYRVGMVPESVGELTKHGHTVMVEKDAGLGIGFTDKDYLSAGAKIISTGKEIFEKAELVVKVKEPQKIECGMLSAGQTIFTFLHLAADLEQTELLQQSGCSAIAYETVTDKFGRLPLLSPMSEVAGRVSVQVGAHYLEKWQQGRGVLLGGVPGVSPGKIAVIGGGVVGSNAIKIALGFGADVTVFDKSLPRLRELEDIFGSQLDTQFATEESLLSFLPQADLVIGAVLVPGAEAPKVVSREMIKRMSAGSVIVDVAIDQGGCLETSRPTNFSDPTYVEEGVIHCCVTNLPGSVPRTSTFALNHATLPFIIELANKGCMQALKGDEHLLAGLNIHKGYITHSAVAKAFNKEYHSPKEVI